MKFTDKTQIYLDTIHIETSGYCGYCKNETFKEPGWITSGFEAKKMLPRDYQKLIDFGWRRSGNYFFKPHAQKCCCQPYSIRLDATKFQENRSQKKKIKKFYSFLDLLAIFKKLNGSVEHLNFECSITLLNKVKELSEKGSDINKSYYSSQDSLEIITELTKWMNQINTLRFKSNKTHLNSTQMSDVKIVENRKFEKTYMCNYLMMTVSIMEKNNMVSKEDKPKLIKEIFEYICENRPQMNRSIDISLAKESYLVFIFDDIKTKTMRPDFKIQSSKGNDKSISEPIKLNDEDRIRFEPVIVKAQYEEEAYKLYQKYMDWIHKEKVSKREYIHFLCQQTLEYSEIKDPKGNETLFCGSFHYKYYIESRLLAVSVVDIMPQGISSVLFFYDPEFSKYSIGSLGAMMDIQKIQNESLYFPKFTFYYNGLYIANFPKTKYKTDFQPYEVLCPRSYRFVSSEEDILKEGLCNYVYTPKDNNYGPKPYFIDDPSNPIHHDMTKISDKDLEDYVIQNTKLLISGELLGIDRLKYSIQESLIKKMSALTTVTGREALKNFIFI